jgi:sugar lactone lactonase YvrE
MSRNVLTALAFTSLLVLAPLTADSAPILTTIVSFDPAVGDLPESLTIGADGSFYLSMSTATIKRVAPNHTVSTFATLPVTPGAFATGLKFGPDGYLYAGSGAFSPSPSGAFIWRISPAGVVTQYAALDPNGFPNDLAFDDHGNLFVTDPFLGLVWKIDHHTHAASIWLADPLLAGNPAHPALTLHSFGVDGIAFDEDKRSLYFGNVDFGEILKVDVECDGSAGDLEVFAGDAKLLGVDGIAFDKKGTLYAAINGQDSIAAVDEHGHVSTVVTGAPLDSPSSLVFGNHGNDKKTLYVSNFAVLRAFGVKPGPAQPSLVSLPVKTAGLPLD